MKMMITDGKLGNFFNIRSVILLHFLIFSIGLLELTRAISHKIGAQRFNFNTTINHMCDWIAAYEHGTVTQLLFFCLSLGSLLGFFGFYWFVIVRIHKKLDIWVCSYHPVVWFAYFVACLSINVVIVMGFSESPTYLRWEIALWFLAFMALPSKLCMQGIKKNVLILHRKYALSLRGCWIAVGLVSLTWVVIYFPLIFKPFHVMNDFMDIPEQTVLNHGQIVDNTRFINTHRIGGWYLYDPRKDNGVLGSSQDIVQISLPKVALLELFLTAPAHALFVYDDATHVLSLKGNMDSEAYKDLLDIYKYDPKSAESINVLFTKSNQIAHFYKTRVYTPEEQDFIAKNAMENKIKTMPGWFFFHHSWVLNSILAMSLDAAQKQVLIYGWGSTVFLKNVMLLLGGVNFQNYFKVAFAFYPIYFFVFLATLYGVFRRVDFVCIGAVLFSVSMMKLQYLAILLAPGYNPIRHVFDMLIILFFFFYLKKNVTAQSSLNATSHGLSARSMNNQLQKNNQGYLFASLLLGFLSILWSKDFGLFLVLALIGTNIIRAWVMDGFSWKSLLFFLSSFVVAVVLYCLPLHGANYNLAYMLLGYTLPQISTFVIYMILVVLGVGYLLHLTYRNKVDSPYYWLSICLFFYVQAQLIYYVWCPSPEHFLVLAPTLIMLGLVWAVLFKEKESKALKKGTVRIGLLVCILLFGFYAVTLVRFYKDRLAYEKNFSTHIVYDWLFRHAKFQTTMHPALFSEAIRFIHHYESHPAMYIISKYDAILPVLAHRYQALPVVNMMLDLMSYDDIERCVQAINRDKPQYIFVDTDIARERRTDILSESDSLVADGYYHESYVRALAHKSSQQLFVRIQNDYQAIEKGRLLTVYQRKPGG